MRKIFLVLLSVAILGGIFLVSEIYGFFEITKIQKLLENNAQTQKKYIVAIISTGGAYEQAVSGLKKGMSDLGYHEGENLEYIIKDTGGNTNAIAPIIDELFNQNPDVIYSISTPITEQVKKLNNNLYPIVFNIVGDPVGAGFVASYPSPQSNLTGCSNLSAELSGKRLAIFKEAFPEIKRVITYYNPDNSFSQIALNNLKTAADILQIEIIETRVKDAGQLKTSLAELQPDDIQGIYVIPDAIVVSNIDLVVNRANEIKLPTMGHEQTLAEKGVTLTYGANFYQLGIQCASAVNNVLHGAKPENIPVLTPNKLEIVINSKSLSALNLDISQNILKSADLIIK